MRVVRVFVRALWTYGRTESRTDGRTQFPSPLVPPLKSSTHISILLSNEDHSGSEDSGFPDSEHVDLPEEELRAEFEITPRWNLVNPEPDVVFALSAKVSSWLKKNYEWRHEPGWCSELVIDYSNPPSHTKLVKRIWCHQRRIRNSLRKWIRDRKTMLETTYHIPILKGELLNEQVNFDGR